MRKLDTRWVRFIAAWPITFVLTLALMGLGRGLDSVSETTEFTNGFREVRDFVLSNGAFWWTAGFAFCLIGLLVLLDKHAEANLAGKRGLKLLFVAGFLVVIGLTLFTCVNMINSGFNAATLIALTLPTLIATLAATRKRTVSSTS